MNIRKQEQKQNKLPAGTGLDISRIVKLYGFLLTVLVIWIHAVDPQLAEECATGTDPLAQPLVHYHLITQFLGNFLGQIAVPGFFLSSGYLFFRNAAAREGTEFFAKKLKKRFFTLLLPYVIWNLLYYLVYLAAGRTGLSAHYIFRALFYYAYNPVFWYMHELIGITILTPLIYLCLRKVKLCGPVLLLVLSAAAFYNYMPFHFVNEDALFYYMLGAAAALHGKQYAEHAGEARQTGIAAACSGVLFLLCQLAVRYCGGVNVLYFIILGRAAADVGLFLLLKYLQESGRGSAKPLPVFCDFSFFIYAVHYMEIRFFRLVVKLALGESISEHVMETALYILMPVLCIGVSVLLGKWMKKKTPQVYRILCGGR